MSFRVVKIVLLWVFPIAYLLGSWMLADYSNRPGNVGVVPADLNAVDEFSNWMTEESLVSSDEPTLILFYHPHCPCTKATIENLRQAVDRSKDRIRIVAFGFCPSDQPDSWISSPLTTNLRRLKASVVADKSGEYCSKFGVTTSGHVLLYGHQGQLLFSGGITSGRGHEGVCPATRDLVKQIKAEAGSQIRWPVFGCSIVTSEVSKQ